MGDQDVGQALDLVVSAGSFSLALSFVDECLMEEGVAGAWSGSGLDSVRSARDILMVSVVFVMTPLREETYVDSHDGAEEKRQNQGGTHGGGFSYGRVCKDRVLESAKLCR